MNHRDFDPYNDDAFWEEVSRDTEARKAAPLAFAFEALEDLFRYEDDKERGHVRWQRKMELAIWWADDAIQCLELVMAAPPPNLGELLREHGISIWVQGPDGETIGDAQAHAAWVCDTTRRLRETFDAHVAARTAEQKAAREAESESESESDREPEPS